MKPSELKLKRYLQRKEKEKSAPPKSTSFLNSKAWSDYVSAGTVREFEEFIKQSREQNETK